MKEKLKEYCRELNIEYVGIAPPGPYTELEKILRDRMDKGHYPGFDENSIQKMIHPRWTLESVRSVIVCLFPYFSGHNEDANISKYAFGQDYHTVAKNKLEQIGDFLKDSIKDFQYQAFADTGPLADRYLAYLAGLGFWGMNTHIITEKYGSYVLIGYILNNYPFEPDRPLDQTCVQCGKCINACPGGALLGNFALNPLRCRSYITQKKGKLSEHEIEILRKHHLVYGCDICQDVCPHNMDARHTIMQEFVDDCIHKVNYDDIKGISNREFKRKYQDKAFSWVGRKVLLRNMELMDKEN